MQVDIRTVSSGVSRGNENEERKNLPLHTDQLEVTTKVSGIKPTDR